MYFPQLVAGPIERATHILPQIQKPRKFSFDQAHLGMRIILWGLFKKVVVADSLAEYANYAFAHYQTEGTGTLVLGVIYFAFQIYCDFSGYSDIAIGTSRLFGIELMRNFNVPYFSKSIAEFWRKWHISLSYWFRDYVYIPLGGSVENPFWRFRNLLVVFLLSGFWHGANWTYVIWGLVHVLFYIPSVFFGKSNRKKGFLDMIGTFLIVCLAWIFFRAASIDEAFGYIQHMFINVQHWESFGWFCRGLILLIPFILIEWINRDNATGIPFIQFNWSRPIQMTYETVLAVLIIISFYTLDHEQFIYFQF
jgi:D-alanyl-lipoteichoic acid acyltransferase DltB (MBOAT superfamily)